jgi:predicted SAM-dependent methyltransferase
LLTDVNTRAPKEYARCPPVPGKAETAAHLSRYRCPGPVPGRRLNRVRFAGSIKRVQVINRTDGGALLDYFRRLQVSEAENPRLKGVAGLLRPLVPARSRPAIKILLTHLVMVRTRRQADRILASGRRIQLHLGCGEIHVDGWCNVDLVGAGAADFIWDLREPLPFPDHSVDAIFHEHLLEHLTYWQGVGLFRECRRLLRPGGVLRLGVPDFGRYATDYANHAGFIEGVRAGRPTRLLALAEIAYCYQHVSMWDGETLTRLFLESGFDRVEVRQSGDTRLDPVPDTDYRRPETLYVEGLAGGAQAPQTSAPIPRQESRHAGKEIHA